MFDVKGKKALVVGLGISGLESAKLLIHYGAKVKISDSGRNDSIRNNLLELSGYDVETEIGKHTEKFIDGVDLVVVSPGVAVDSGIITDCRLRGLPVISELELGYRFCKAPIIAITGTNGKSTTTELIGSILRTAGMNAIVCGNIGNPLSGEIKNIGPDTVIVTEVSSFQLETIEEFKPYIAVLLNISDDHYERHKDLITYRSEKVKIFRNQDPNDWAIINSSFTGDAFLRGIRPRICYYGQDNNEIRIENNEIILNWEGEKTPLIDIRDIPFKGMHNIYNVESAVLASKIMKVSNEDIRKGIKTFRSLAHRFESLGTFGGVEFIDDSKATNIDAAAYAVRSVDRKVVLIAGGIDKGGDYSSIFPVVKGAVKSMIVIGQAKEKLKKIFSRIVDVHEAEDMRHAVNLSVKLASPGEIVLLSPMCSSFDMFSGYKERGEVFQQAVFEKMKVEKEGCQTKDNGPAVL